MFSPTIVINSTISRHILFIIHKDYIYSLSTNRLVPNIRVYSINYIFKLRFVYGIIVIYNQLKCFFVNSSRISLHNIIIYAKVFNRMLDYFCDLSKESPMFV